MCGQRGDPSGVWAVFQNLRQGRAWRTEDKECPEPRADFRRLTCNSLVQRKNTNGTRNHWASPGTFRLHTSLQGRGLKFWTHLPQIFIRCCFILISTQRGIPNPVCLITRKISLVYNIYIIYVIKRIMSAVLWYSLKRIYTKVLLKNPNACYLSCIVSLAREVPQD